MNVLVFVMTMLMLLSIMTYARIESFRDLSGLKSQFEWYMQEYERSAYNKAIKKKYDDLPRTKTKDGTDPEAKQKEEEQACSKLPFYFLLNKQQREARHDVFNQHILLTKMLIRQLYSDAPFFKKAEESQPDIVDMTLQSLMNAADKLPKSQTITTAADLSSVDLGNESLNEFFYRILKGTVNIDEQDEAETYPSLINFVTVKNKTSIRIFLASHDLLMAIYDNPSLVKDIEETRIQLYQAVKDGKEKEEASNEFSEMFKGKQREGIDEKTLDFRVTKTNPKDYA